MALSALIQIPKVDDATITLIDTAGNVVAEKHLKTTPHESSSKVFLSLEP